MLRKIFGDFVSFGSLRMIARFFLGVRGILIITTLTPLFLGHYAVLLLFVFYFSMLDFGAHYGLERDLPHFNQTGEEAIRIQTANEGWSAYYIMNVVAAFCLWGTLTFFKVGYGICSPFLVMFYFLFDKAFRGYLTEARIELRYQQIGIAEVLYGSISCISVFFLVRHLGIPGIFISFILGLAGAILFLQWRGPIRFQWIWEFKKLFRYLKSSVALSMITYEIRTFQYIPATMLAILWDRETLGYFVFSFRIFEILLSLFPLLIQEVFKTRLYQQLAVQQQNHEQLRIIYPPMFFYGVLCAGVGLITYWLMSPIVTHTVPLYITSIPMLQVLVLALFPLGAAQMMSDFLLARQIRKNISVISAWGLGILFQAVILIFIPRHSAMLGLQIVFTYLIAALLMYFILVFRLNRHWLKPFRFFCGMAFSLLAPLIWTVVSLVLAGLIGILPSSEWFVSLVGFVETFFTAVIGVGFYVLFLNRTDFQLIHKIQSIAP
ncbi:MAG: hypothetical protein COV74_09840 [Candidatus Omnitrophica bacterium CG11_big_fil_rev_8_21_14_0_20_45_26]|uniref:Polysaccharide biosynthesis protein C-terminal domain-containing protein n=1 Tax=Candidatus Abzuiibacterium crystallinum TaxID=1974748 RepID=A0A2H0LLI4_9BACT|nr:MAG: hypothetical protein COV74_09840 [Candidatus Omnitrophica bacterium CG11_big_fil_rev_8_21_14_0_20_45_26]PIW64507.1 MAG: hypothetical protein COW12_05965 [Candidatus Omnitrophica bacterium CG12_big_fil_rev_8_21_14_0_65_45_16]